MRQTYRFLDFLDLPMNLQQQQPSIQFEQGLTEWIRLRSHELELERPPNYQYYGAQGELTSAHCWRNHDGMLTQELTPYDSQSGLTFEELGDYPSRVLTSVAWVLGWRIVPYARWAAYKSGDQLIAHYIEEHCRKWCADADTVTHTLQGAKINRTNALSQKAHIQPLRIRAAQLIETAQYELGKYHP